MSFEKILLITQIFIILSLFSYAYLVAYKQDSRQPIDHIGILWLVALVMYTVLPLIVWSLYGNNMNYRLSVLNPDLNTITSINNIVIAYFFGFAITYHFLIAGLRRPSFPMIKIPKIVFYSSCFIYFLSYASLEFIWILNNIREVESYADSYLVISEQSLVFKQIFKLLHGIRDVSLLIIVVFIFQNFKKYWLLLFVYILLKVFLDGALLSSRSGMITIILLAVLVWHVNVSQIKFWQAALIILFSIFIFGLFGVIRSGGSLVSLGEFSQVWTNGVELLQFKLNNTNKVLPFYTRFNSDLFAFIPSQLLWFDKQSLSVWYLQSYHLNYTELGQGLAFGAISQVVVGGGIYEAFFRGALSAIIGYKLLNMFRHPSLKIWKFMLYLYIYSYIFRSIRDTQLRPIVDIIQVYLPSIFIIMILSMIIKSVAVKRVNQ